MIVLKRGENAFGVGPVLTLSIFGDGRVAFEPGEDHPLPIYKPAAPKPRMTPYHRSISQQQLGELVLQMSSVDLFSMKDRYVDAGDGCPHVVSDQASFTLTLTLQSGEQKTIRHYQGCLDDGSDVSSVYPRPLRDLERRLLSFAE